MRKLALAAVSAVFLGNAHALVVGVPPMNPFMTPESFRSATNHHKVRCETANIYCLAYHLMYLQCGAILVEKMALEEGAIPEWYAYSMHSGPKLPLVLAAYEILPSFDPSLPGTWYSGEEFDPRFRTPRHDDARGPYSLDSLNTQLTRFIQQTVDWLDSRDTTLADACELRSFWKELRSNSSNPADGPAASGGDRSDMSSVIE